MTQKGDEKKWISINEIGKVINLSIKWMKKRKRIKIKITNEIKFKFVSWVNEVSETQAVYFIYLFLIKHTLIANYLKKL
jgi:hypothetical protein